MSNSLHASFIWSQALAIRSSELFYNYEFRHSYRRYVGWIFIAMAQFGMVGALKHDSYGMLFVSSFLLLYWYGIRWQLRKLLAKHQFQASPLADQTVDVTFSDRGLIRGQLLTPWKEIAHVIQNELGFLFFMASKSTFVPKEAFGSTDESAKLSALLQAQGVAYTKAS